MYFYLHILKYVNIFEVKMKKRKDDIRTKYTCRLIKDTFLELLENISYEKLNISIICKKAKIARATFYLHYNNLNQVLLEVLDEALELSNNISNESLNDTNKEPLCQKPVSPKYQVLFNDFYLSNYIASRLYNYAKKDSIKKFMKNYNLTEYEAEKLFLFIFYGSFSINKSLKWEKNEEWNHKLPLQVVVCSTL